MKPDAYMPYYGADFEQATKGFRREVKWSYMAAQWHYWAHTHCAGLPDDDEYLAGICDCAPTDWARTKGMIFGPFFTLVDGKWHQPRAARDYAEAVESYKRQCHRTVKARSVNPRNASVTASVTAAVTAPVTATATVQQPESEPEPLYSTVHKQRGAPTLQQVVAFGNMQGMAKEDCERFWHHFNSSDWIDKNGNRVMNWQSKLMTWKASNQAAPLEAAHKAAESGGGYANGAQTVAWSKELDRCIQAVQKLKENAAQDAMGAKLYTKAEKQRLKELTARRDELKTKLGVVV
jgi:uncharacterized protein YdaU (DUF1376 family)